MTTQRTAGWRGKPPPETMWHGEIEVFLEISHPEMTQAANSGAGLAGAAGVIPSKCLPALVNRPRLATNAAEKRSVARSLNSAG